MNAKQKEVTDKLKRIRKLDKEIKVMDLEIQYLEDGLFSKSTLTQTKVLSSKTTDTADKYNKQIERKEELRQKINDLLEERTRLANLIDLVDDPEQRMVLRLFFVNGMSVDEVGRMLRLYSERQVYYKKRISIEALAKALSC